MKKASSGKRFAALLFDLLISLVLALIASVPTILAMINCYQDGADKQEVWALLVAATTGGAFLLLVLILYFSVVPVYFNGQTFGKRIAKIKLVDMYTGKKPETKFILIRETVRVLLVFITFGVALIISFLCKFLTKEGLSFYDAISRTMVVEVESESLIGSTEDSEGHNEVEKDSNEVKENEVVDIDTTNESSDIKGGTK